MESEFACSRLNQKTFLELSVAVAISMAKLKESYLRLKLLNDKIEERDSLYLRCLWSNMKKRINRQFVRHYMLLNSLKLKAAISSTI